jgi:hypothetical protein
MRVEQPLELIAPISQGNHATRRDDVVPMYLTQAQYDALEDPPDSGLYPSVRNRRVVITDAHLVINAVFSAVAVTSPDGSIKHVISLTQAAYDAIPTKDPQTLYVIN